jgi:hypothetical protein
MDLRCSHCGALLGYENLQTGTCHICSRQFSLGAMEKLGEQALFNCFFGIVFGLGGPMFFVVYAIPRAVARGEQWLTVFGIIASLILLWWAFVSLERLPGALSRMRSMMARMRQGNPLELLKQAVAVVAIVATMITLIIVWLANR